MRPNKIKTAWEENRAAVNVFLSTPGSFTAEVMASLGWDGVTVDMQHGGVLREVRIHGVRAHQETTPVTVVLHHLEAPAVVPTRHLIKDRCARLSGGNRAKER